MDFPSQFSLQTLRFCFDVIVQSPPFMDDKQIIGIVRLPFQIISFGSSLVRRVKSDHFPLPLDQLKIAWLFVGIAKIRVFTQGGK